VGYIFVADTIDLSSADVIGSQSYWFR